MQDKVDEAFANVPRENFLPDEAKNDAWIDAPIPIGYGQTNSQPSTVAMMLNWLDPQPGEKILDVGSGSGWTTALLAYLVASNGKVYAVEKELDLVAFGRNNCQKLGVNNASFFKSTKKFGLAKYAPYDKILVSAAAIEVPKELLNQLKIGGTMVIPVKNSILVINKTDIDNYDTQEHPGFAFVPLI